MKRVAFAGASGTGKTTLARWVAETYALPINPVGSRSVAKGMGFVGPDGEGRPYGVDLASMKRYTWALANGATNAQAAHEALCGEPPEREEVSEGSVRPLFQRKLQLDKIAWEQNTPTFVTDRTSLDDMAYAILHCRDVVDADFWTRAYAHMRQYTHVFYCPATVFRSKESDPARVDDPVYHHIYDRLIYGLLRGLKITTLTESDLDGRKAAVAQDLE